MKIILNGEVSVVRHEMSVAELVATVSRTEQSPVPVDLPATAGQGTPERKRSARPANVAVARNGVVVPRSRWHAERLADDDCVEVLSAAPGG